MEKYVFILVMFAVLTGSCKHDNLYQPKQADFDNIVPFTSYEVPIEEGKVTIVTHGKDTLAITGIPMTIEVPKALVKDMTKSADGISVTYSDDPKFDGYKTKGTALSDCVLMFEDTRNGDCDYNDLIVWVQKREVKSWWPDYTMYCEFTIHPIALGAIKNFKLGVENEAGTKYICAEDCRQELFNGEYGFINTTAKTTPVFYQNKKAVTGEWKYNPSSGGEASLNWFIETEDERMYIAMTNKTVDQSNLEKFGNDKGRPYGIAFPTTAASILQAGGPFYATEGTELQSVYRNFEDWIAGAWKSPLNAGGGKGVNNTDPAVCYNISNKK